MYKILTVFAILAAWGLPLAQANTELDRKFALETVGFLKSWDNVDGLFTDYVSAAYKIYFSRQSRFVLQDLSKADTILSKSKIPYNKLIEDPQVLAQLARSTRSQSLIRTKVQKEGPEYRFSLDWLHTPDMEVMARDSFDMTEPRDGKGFGAAELQAALERSVDRMIHKLPFIGSITGRDGNEVTVNLGTGSGIEPGDTLVVGTLDEVKRHPLLKEIVEWKVSNTGKLVVEQADDRMSFARVSEEEPERVIAKQQKILSVIHKPLEQPVQTDKASGEEDTDEPPHIGWVSGGLNLGSFNRDYNLLDNSINRSGSGFVFGLRADSQIWFTREWFGEIGLNYGSWGYSQKDTTPNGTGASTSLGSANLVTFKLAAGYSYLINGDLFGPKGWLKLGYLSNSYNLPASAADVSTPISFKSFFIGLGADLPIRGGYGAILDLDFGVFNSASESPTLPNLSTSATSATNVALSLGGYYRYTNRITFRATVDFQSNGADFSDRTDSQKVLTVVPAIMYYF